MDDDYKNYKVYFDGFGCIMPYWHLSKLGYGGKAIGNTLHKTYRREQYDFFLTEEDAKRFQKIGCVVIDYLHYPDDDGNFPRWADDIGAPVFELSHPLKISKEENGGKDDESYNALMIYSAAIPDDNEQKDKPTTIIHAETVNLDMSTNKKKLNNNGTINGNSVIADTVQNSLNNITSQSESDEEKRLNFIGRNKGLVVVVIVAVLVTGFYLIDKGMFTKENFDNLIESISK